MTQIASSDSERIIFYLREGVKSINQYSLQRENTIISQDTDQVIVYLQWVICDRILRAIKLLLLIQLDLLSYIQETLLLMLPTFLFFHIPLCSFDIISSLPRPLVSHLLFLSTRYALCDAHLVHVIPVLCSPYQMVL